jgi:hypothetical protein
MKPDQAQGWRSRRAVCQREADKEFGPAPNIANLRLTPEESARSDKIYDAVERDPRIVQALAVRKKCIEDKGFDSDDSRSLPLSKAAEKFRDGFEAAVSEAELKGRDSATLRLADVFSAAELAELKGLQQREMAEAVQVEPCQWPYDDVYKEVYKQFLDKALAGEL